MPKRFPRFSSFRVQLVKPSGELSLIGDADLLSAERKVHQQYRWLHDLPLRIDAQYCSGPLFCDALRSSWHIGNCDFLEVHTPLKYLREGVIDAWIGCHPDVPGDDDCDFACFHLTRLPTYLVVSEGHPLLALGNSVTLDAVKKYPSLVLPPNAFPRFQQILQGLGLWSPPLNIQHRNGDKQIIAPENLSVGYANPFTLHLFHPPRILLPIKINLGVGDSLVVPREYAEHPRLIELLAHLKIKAFSLSQEFTDVHIPSGSVAHSCLNS